MRFPVQTSALFVLLGMLLSPPPQEGHASSPPADSVHFCQPAESGHAGQSVDADQRELDHPGPASKWAADLDVGEPRTVRLFYFLPNDRPYRTEVVDSMKAGILDLQSFFAEQMEAHEQGNTTFQIETDAQGDPVVHRVDGDYTDSHYSSRGYTEGEIERAYDNAANIILIVMDVSTRSAHGRGTGTKGSGWVMIYGEWNWFVAAHELGHTFGLHHDFRDNTYVMSYGRANRSSAQLSACAAEFLAVHPYFNPDVPLENESPPTIELISPTEYLAGSESVSVRLRVRNDEGLHQVILFVKTQNPFLGGTPEVKACRGLVGETDAIVEFDYDGITPSDKVGTAPEAHTSLSNTPRHKIYVVAVDTDGNRTSTFSPISFDLMETSPYDLATLSNGGEIFSVVFSPDGTTLAVGTSYNNVGLWDVATRAPIAALSGHTDNVYSVSFSPDGTTLASGSGDNTVKLWDVATRTNTATLSGHTDRVRSVSFSPDGAMVASGSLDGTVKLWDVTTRAHIATLSGHTDNVFSVSFSPDGTTLASGSNDRTVKLWDVATRNNTATLEHRAWAYSVDFSSDGTTLAATSGSRVELWDVPTREKIATLYPRTYDESISSVSFSPDGAVLALGSGYKTVELWDVATKEKIVHFSGHTRGVYSVDFSPDGTMLASSAWDGKVKLWDTSEWTAPITPVSDISEQIWSGTITGGTWGNDFGNGNATGYGYSRHHNAGSISNPTFTYRGNTYTIHGISLSRIGNNLTHQYSLLISPRFPACDEQQLTLSSFRLSDGGPGGAYGASWYLWRLRTHEAWPVGHQVSYSIILHPTVPDAPAVTAINEGNQVLLSWTTPCDGGKDITRHEYRQKTRNGAFGSWIPIPNSGAGGVNLASYTLAVVNNPQEHIFEVRAVNELGEGLVSTPVSPSDRTTQVAEAILNVVKLDYPSVTSFADITDIHVAGITALYLNGKNITALKSGDFKGLTSLTELRLNGNQLTTLPEGIFDGLTALRNLNLYNNRLSGLPDGLFQGLTALTQLRLGGNSVDPLPLTLSLEKVADGQFKAVAPTGAPFDIIIPLNVANGSISGGATTITIPKGSVESQPLTEARTPGTTAPVTVDIGTLPSIPSGHQGYTLVKSADLPLEIFSSGETGTTAAATDFNGDGRTDFVDFFLFADAYGGNDARFDLDGNGTVDFADFFRFVDAFGS